MKKEYSEAVCAAMFILFFAIVFAECATAQEVRHGPRRIPWSNNAYFETRQPTKVLNWGDYLETWDGKTMTTWGAFAAAGIMHGAREAYHADPYVFERRWGAGETSFWGSDAWKRNYENNNPEQPHKTEILGNVGRDMWHTFGFGSKALMFGGTFAIGARKQPIKYRIANAVIGWGVHSIFANVSYQTLR